jgi:hypothetical protein
MKQVDPILYLLATLVLLFTILLFVSAKFLTNDGQTFQVMSGLLTGFAGAFLGRVKPPDPANLPPGSKATASVETITPPEKP